jgi:hypothetical protein
MNKEKNRNHESNHKVHDTMEPSDGVKEVNSEHQSQGIESDTDVRNEYIIFDDENPNNEAAILGQSMISDTLCVAIRAAVNEMNNGETELSEGGPRIAPSAISTIEERAKAALSLSAWERTNISLRVKGHVQYHNRFTNRWRISLKDHRYHLSSHSDSPPSHSIPARRRSDRKRKRDRMETSSGPLLASDAFGGQGKGLLFAFNDP